MHLVANLLQRAGKLGCRNIRQHQHKLISAIADDVVSALQAFLRHSRHSAQRRIAHVMTIDIVIKLEIIYIQHRYTGRLRAIFHQLLIEAAVINLRQRIHIQQIAVMAVIFTGLCIRRRINDCVIAGYLRNQLQHIGFALYHQVLCNHLIQRFIIGLILRLLLLVHQHSAADAVHAALLLAPKFVAFALLPFAIRLNIHDLTFTHIYQAHNIKNLAQLFDSLNCLSHSQRAFVIFQNCFTIHSILLLTKQCFSKPCQIP